jgi:hypothetical protein
MWILEGQDYVADIANTREILLTNNMHVVSGSRNIEFFDGKKMILIDLFVGMEPKGLSIAVWRSVTDRQLMIRIEDSKQGGDIIKEPNCTSYKEILNSLRAYFKDRWLDQRTSC